MRFFISKINMKNLKPIKLYLEDTSWEYKCTKEIRKIARGIIVDDNNNFYFVKGTRNDIFGKLNFIETSGGGVEFNESYRKALKREIKEELGVDIEIICYLGEVVDYYNLINRKNLNHYFLAKVKSFGKNHLTKDEKENFHLKMIKLTYGESLLEYEKMKTDRLGRLIYQREIPILEQVFKILE